MGQYIPAPEGDSSIGVAPGGLEDQVLRKASDLNYDTEWADLAGTPGPTGPAGANGTAATIAVGTTTTGAAGSSATVTNAGTSSAAVFNFTIPRGDTGATPSLTGYAQLAVAQNFTAAQRGAAVALTDGATVAVDLSLANNFTLTLGGNRTLGAPTNQTAGQGGVIVITQDATGSRTLAYNAVWKFPGGTAPTLTTTASAVDVLAYYVESGTRITARLVSDVK
jgi:hypothetical protein